MILFSDYALIVFPFFSVLAWAGHECESSRNSLETDLFWNEPANLSTNMAVHHCCRFMYSNTNELSEQGNSCCFFNGYFSCAERAVMSMNLLLLC